LKPNGFIRWNFAGDGTCTNFNSIVQAMMGDDDYKNYFVNFEWPWFMPSKDEYEEILASSGFSEVRIQLDNMDRYFSDCDEMIGWIDQPTIVPFLKYIPEKEKEGFRNRVVDMMIKKTKIPDGRCFETFKRINLKAVKE